MRRSLSRPFRKNVRFIILVRPSGMLKTLLAILRPFTSAKAAQKIKNVRAWLCLLAEQHWQCSHSIAEVVSCWSPVTCAPFQPTKLRLDCCVQVESLASIGQATNHEVMIHHLGSRFAAAAGRYIADSMAETQRGIAPSRGSSSSSQTFAMPGLS